MSKIYAHFTIIAIFTFYYTCDCKYILCSSYIAQANVLKCNYIQLQTCTKELDETTKYQGKITRKVYHFDILIILS